MRTALLCTTVVLLEGLAPAQNAPSPPPIVRVYVERVKPGKGPAHEKSEAAFVHVLSKANYPAHYLALTAMSGPDEAWYVEEHTSFAEVETSEKAGDTPAIKPELDQVSATDGEYISGGSSMIGVYRPDLSYRGDQATANLPKARYFNVITLRLKPGSDARLAGAVRDMTNMYNNVQVSQPVVAYQIISGAPGRRLVQHLNYVYKSEPALWQLDDTYEGFDWIDFHDADNSVVSFLRKSRNGDIVAFVVNATPLVRYEYRLGVPETGFWREIINTDAETYGGSNVGNYGGVRNEDVPWMGRQYSILIHLPPLATVAFKLER